jgi:ABC-type Fe3+/spermidine/putrescine transport system ATPase subunit
MNAGRIEQQGTPIDVYQRPATEFVARFIGNAAIIDALPDGDGVRLLGVRYNTPPQGSKAVLRSDAVALKPDGLHAARVLHATFLGRDIRYILETADGTRVSVDQAAHAPGTPLRAGDEVRFSIRPERLHFIE